MADNGTRRGAERLAHFHLYATMVWAFLVIPSILWWSSSVAWLVVMSVWANLAGHFSAWQAARSEVYERERDLRRSHRAS